MSLHKVIGIRVLSAPNEFYRHCFVEKFPGGFMDNALKGVDEQNKDEQSVVGSNVTLHGRFEEIR